MTMVRFLFLAGTSIFINVSKWYLDDSMGLPADEQTKWGFIGLGAAGVGTALAALPAARISNRTGRKPVIWTACLVAGLGLALIAIAPSPPLAVAGLVLMGTGAGSYLAVDWALMTETIPLVTSGRYMGLANIANSIAGPVGLLLVGPLVIDLFTGIGMIELGPRAAVALGIPALALAGIILIGVRPRRDPRALPQGVS
jgi:MFS family permease